MDKKELEKEIEHYLEKLNSSAYDDAMASGYIQEQMEEMRAESIDSFRKERLQEYYINNKNLTQIINNSLKRAKKMIDLKLFDAGFVFSFTTIEIILKNIFLKPILHGSFMDQYVADLVVKEILRTKYSSIRKILFHVLIYSANFNFETYKRSGIKITLWSEIMNTREQRNKIIHRGEVITSDKAKRSYKIATHLSKVVFPKIINNLGLKIVKGEIVYQ